MSVDISTAILILEDGRTFVGEPYGGVGETIGEIVFNTGMTGYQETLTDPSYHRQIVVMTAPHIGNTGMNDEDRESKQIWVAGYVVRDPSPRASNWRSRHELVDELRDQGVVGISGIDTRALTRHIRDRGVMRAGIFSGPALLDENGNPVALRDILARVVSANRMLGADLAREVATNESYVVEPQGTPVATVVALDLGIKVMTPQRFAERGVRVHVLPAQASIDDVLSYQPDGVFFSNGPGDPATADDAVALARDILERKIPFFGICFGHQILGRALGFDTYKLTYGHRGINQPVLDRATGKVEVTAHNHGFAVNVPLDGPVTAPHGDGRFGQVEVSHVGLNDAVVEGIACLDLPAFSVQYHPEAAAGPHDASHLFDRFVAQISREEAQGRRD